MLYIEPEGQIKNTIAPCTGYNCSRAYFEQIKEDYDRLHRKAKHGEKTLKYCKPGKFTKKSFRIQKRGTCKTKTLCLTIHG